MDITQLSDFIVKFLRERQNNLGLMNIEKDSLDKSFHLTHELIQVVNVTIDHIKQLVCHENTEWVDWIKTGLAYNNEITFQLKYDDYQTLPIDFFNNYSIKILNSAGNRVWLFNKKAITFQQIYQCSADDLIVIQKNQLITEYARDYCRINEIKLIERF